MKTNRLNSKDILILKIAIACTAVPDISQSTVTPALGNIQAAMPHVDIMLIQLLTTIASGCLALFSPIYAKSTRYIKRKTLLYIGFILFLVGGLTPTWLHSNIWIMLFFRALAGLSAAIVMPFTVDYVVNFFEGNEQRSMLGYCACVTALGATLFMTLGGWLANIKWNYCFLAECAAVPFFIFALIFLPEPPENTKPEEDNIKEKYSASSFKQMPLVAWIMVLIRICWEICTMVTNSTLSIMLIGEKMTDSTTIGMVFSTSTISSIVFSFLFGKLYKTFKRYLLPLTCLLGALAFFVLSKATSMPVVFIGSALRGIAYGVFGPAMFNVLSVTVPKEVRTTSTSWGYTAQGLGAFLSTFAFGFLHSVSNTVQGRHTFSMCWKIILFITIIVVIYNFIVFDKEGNPKRDPDAY